MEKRKTSVIENLKSDIAGKGEESEETRPVKFVPDGFNSWRVVWAEN